VGGRGEPVSLVGEEDGLVTDLQAREQVVQVASVGDRHGGVSFAVENEACGERLRWRGWTRVRRGHRKLGVSTMARLNRLCPLVNG
jgi:hypothetical protein